jgi:N-acetylglucosaminyldiphosphoundecaprenol N-acetyl-beta-D-mannosaminyltransferase
MLRRLGGKTPFVGELPPADQLNALNSQVSGASNHHSTLSHSGIDSSQPLGGNRVWVFGLPLAPLTMAGTVKAIYTLIEIGQPTYIITANTHYAMLSEKDLELRKINAAAALIIADGAPLVWAARWTGQPLPERVAGSDLIFELSEEAARKQSRLFLLGGAKGIADEAARRLCATFPGLQIVGTECPSLQELTEEEEKALIARIHATRPDILLVAFGQPKGERWIHHHLHELGVPISIQVGASLDFAAGMIRRAPRWMQKSGLEWAFRLALEPRRLFWRYACNASFISRNLVWEMCRVAGRVLRSPLFSDSSS